MYSRPELVVKRAFDIAGALGGLVATAPLIAASAVLVKLSSPGPIFFRQERVGRAGRPFEMIKFRTMRVDASGPQVTAGTDSRITPIGRILRKTKLDELPELVNVLRGDMSLVGPRPEVPRYVALYPDEDREFLQRVRPGITDPVTVRLRNEEEILARSNDPEMTYRTELLPMKVRLYRDYLENASLATDLRVLFDTVRVVLVPSQADA